MNIKSEKIEIVEIDSLIVNPKNNNMHPPDQIERLSKLIKYQGFRNPVIVSNRTGFVVAGHGRIEAAKKIGMKNIPVIFQDFENEAQEYAYLTSDNAIASWAKIDMALLSEELLSFGEDIEIDLLGIKNLEIDALDGELPELDSGDPDLQRVSVILSNQQKDLFDSAILKAKKTGLCLDEINSNSTGNALSFILELYVNG